MISAHLENLTIKRLEAACAEVRQDDLEPFYLEVGDDQMVKSSSKLIAGTGLEHLHVVNSGSLGKGAWQVTGIKVTCNT